MKELDLWTHPNMAQTLIWNFEWTNTPPKSMPHLPPSQKESIKWERRYFWPGEEQIQLSLLGEPLSNLSSYKQQFKEDMYYLLPSTAENIKKRKDVLYYKPLIKKTDHSYGYGKKIKLNEEEHHDLLLKIERDAKIIPVKKEAYIYKFATEPVIKLELARVEVLNQIYYSACIEGKSLYFVETLSELIFNTYSSSEYITFLKNLAAL